MAFSRRSFLATCAQTSLYAAVAGVPRTALAAAANQQYTSGHALTMLMQGNARYRNGTSEHRDRTARREEVSSGQDPFAMVLSCSDSRVPPDIIFDQTLGNLFVVRIAGNCAFAAGTGSLEYAYEHFHSPLLMVLGHSGCGAVKAAVDGVASGKLDAPGDIGVIVKAIAPAVNTVRHMPGDIYANATAENARQTAAKLRHQPPILSKGLSDGLRVVSAVYDLKSGLVSLV